jgi:hypothetical protein
MEIAASCCGRQGIFVAEGAPNLDTRSTGDVRLRQAAEKRAIVLLAGAAAQTRGTGMVAYGYECDDHDLVFDLLGAIEPDDTIASSWFWYLHERTRVLVENDVAWRTVSELTAALLLRGWLSGDEVRRIATAFLERLEAMPKSDVVKVPVLGRWPTL